MVKGQSLSICQQSFFFSRRELIKRGIGVIQSDTHIPAHNICRVSYMFTSCCCRHLRLNSTLPVPPSTTGVSKVEFKRTAINIIRGSGWEEGLNNECASIIICKCTHIFHGDKFVAASHQRISAKIHTFNYLWSFMRRITK